MGTGGGGNEKRGSIRAGQGVKWERNFAENIQVQNVFNRRKREAFFDKGNGTGVRG